MHRLFSLFLAAALSIAPAPSSRADQLPTPATLPQRIYALPGKPCLIHFDTLIYTPEENSLLYDVESGPGAQQIGRWLWHVKAGEEKNTPPLQIGVYSGKNFQKITTLNTEVIKADPAAVSQQGSIRWLPIGDSLTFPGHYISQSLSYLQKELPGITLATVGTQHPKDTPALFHEGRGGWSWVRYQENKDSPFVFSNGNAVQLDFGRYIREKLNGQTPEVITFFLGANDVYGIAADYTPEKTAILQQRAKAVVAHIREAAPHSIIGIIIPPPPSDQNAFGTNYPVGVTEWQYRRAMQHYSAALIAAFDAQWDQKIYIIPAHLGFQRNTAYPMAGNRAQNALHPTAAGFEPISDAISAWFIYLLTTQQLLIK